MRRWAGATSVFFAVLGALIVWRLSVSPDSDWKTGLFVAAPSLVLAAVLAAVAVVNRAGAGQP